ncbi:phage portal protein [Oceaniovalibus sp. ACAM 378]|uniref:phage portal protein n=1 Tax=Oceaniovalibus sp. ACAM 378 TaxID=2599923 RepID=UPI0011D4450D|nr:phage portal protein [Oceaniovalibus sp. ACAM 378]TYB83963.1 phage portal protein [Oceaniovalibus sp. ACAM 378]
MNILDRMIAGFSPERGLRRARARAATAHYDAATSTRRGQSWKVSGADADAASRKRDRLAFVSRDLVRNNPFALRGQQVITNNMVGDGIIPKIIDCADEELRKTGFRMIESLLDTTRIDVFGRQNLYGLQRLAANTIVDSGEVLIQREFHPSPQGPTGRFVPELKLRVMEPDYLDPLHDGLLSNGHSIEEGIEYDADGKRVAYHLFAQHPGAASFRGVGWSSKSTRVPADHVLHIYRQDRPGQMRGVSWFAPIAMTLQDLADYQDAQIMRQKIAACFAGFRRLGAEATEEDRELVSLSPGLIQDIGPDEEMTFSDPPDVGGYDMFMSTGLHAVASGLGVTYEALTGDLSGVNFSSGRMGRMEMDRNVSSWQWLMLIPQMMEPIGRWLIEDWARTDAANARTIMASRFDWVPPHRILVDPTREIPALRDAVRAGFASRSGVVRQLGADPERLMEEITKDAAEAKAKGLVFDSDAAAVSAAGVTQAPPPEDKTTTQKGSGNGK